MPWWYSGQWYWCVVVLHRFDLYMDLIRSTTILENSIWNIHQAFSQNSIQKHLMDPKKFLNFHTEGDQGSLGVFRGPLPKNSPTGVMKCGPPSKLWCTMLSHWLMTKLAGGKKKNYYYFVPKLTLLQGYDVFWLNLLFRLSKLVMPKLSIYVILANFMREKKTTPSILSQIKICLTVLFFLSKEAFWLKE